jgi:ABC-type amino acid transport substrate-binding protein
VPLFFHEDISGIRGPDDLKGFLVAVKAGDNSIDILKKHGVTNITEYPSYEKLIEAARDGKALLWGVNSPHFFDFCKQTKPGILGTTDSAYVRKAQTE